MKESQLAKAWRVKAGLTVEQLQDLTGFSREAIWLFERGVRQNGSAVSAYSWQRYRMACAAVQQQLKTGRVFQW
jgi:transcriptional regulator with XRE-family HTH domain